MSKLSKEAKIVLYLSIVLTVFGVYMVYSASNVSAMYKYNDEYFFFKRQLIFAVLGILIMIGLINVPLDLLISKSHILLLVSFIFLKVLYQF